MLGQHETIRGLMSRFCSNSPQIAYSCNQSVFYSRDVILRVYRHSSLVRYVILAISDAQIDFIVFMASLGVKSAKKLGFIFSRPSTSFYDTYKMAAIKIKKSKSK